MQWHQFKHVIAIRLKLVIGLKDFRFLMVKPVVSVRNHLRLSRIIDDTAAHSPLLKSFSIPVRSRSDSLQLSLIFLYILCVTSIERYKFALMDLVGSHCVTASLLQLKWIWPYVTSLVLLLSYLPESKYHYFVSLSCYSCFTLFECWSCVCALSTLLARFLVNNELKMFFQTATVGQRITLLQRSALSGFIEPRLDNRIFLCLQ